MAPGGCGEAAGWLVSVTAAVDAQNACLLPLLVIVEDSDGALSVFRKCSRLAKTQMFFSATSPAFHLLCPYCVCRDGTHVLFPGPLLSLLLWEHSERLLDIAKLGFLCL